MAAKNHAEKWDEFYNTIQGDPKGPAFRAAATRISMTLTLETARRDGADLEDTFPIGNTFDHLQYALSATMSGPTQGLTVAREETAAIQSAMNKDKPKAFSGDKPDVADAIGMAQWAADWVKSLGEVKTWEQGKAAQLSWTAAWIQAGSPGQSQETEEENSNWD